MLVLLTNDDGIFAPGLAAMERVLRTFADVCVVAPSTEQSGVGHAITFLTPLTAKEVFAGETARGWAVDGSPADAVKLGISEFSPRRPDLVVSGINSGLNAGINVLYSGTVAAAIEGAFFGITSIAVSLEWDDHADYDRAAVIGGASRSRWPPRPGQPVQRQHSDGGSGREAGAAGGADERVSLRRGFRAAGRSTRPILLVGDQRPSASAFAARVGRHRAGRRPCDAHAA